MSRNLPVFVEEKALSLALEIKDIYNDPKVMFQPQKVAKIQILLMEELGRILGYLPE